MVTSGVPAATVRALVSCTFNAYPSAGETSFSCFLSLCPEFRKAINAEEALRTSAAAACWRDCAARHSSLLLGCALGYGLSVLLSVLLSEEVFRIPAVVSSKTFLISIGVVLASAAASGLLVWGKVQRLDLIAVLKSRE